MNLSSPSRFLRRLAIWLGYLLLGFVVLFGWASWRSEREEQILQLETALELSEKALDRYFLQVDTGLRELAFDLVSGPGLSDLSRVQLLLKRFNELNPDSVSVNLVALDGQVLATSVADRRTSLPTLASEPSFQDFKARVRPDSGTDLGRPLRGRISEQWVFPVRQAVRGPDARILAYLASAVPVDLMETFWRDAPLFKKTTIGLLRDDGYLLSRYPAPADQPPSRIYGQPRSGALSRHLRQRNYPPRGYVQGHSQISGGENGNVFRRLEHFPVTLFISIPVSEFTSAWWQRVRVPYLLIALLGGVGLLGYRHTLRSENDWNVERRSAEATLERSESRYRMLYENSQEGVLQTDGESGRIVNANPAACRLFGLSEAEICSRGRRGLAARDDPRVAALVRQHRREGHARGEATMIRGDGTRFEAEISSVVYTELSGQRVSSLVMRDVTDRRRAESALAAKEVAERANRAKSEFMARMSHELRTPLNAILGFSQILELDAAHPLQTLHLERLQHIRQAGAHLLSLINDLLDLARIESGTIKLEITRIDVLAMIQELVREVAAQAGERGIQLVMEPPADALGQVRGDRTRMRQVLLNLISNSVKYNADGGLVVVTLDSRDGRLSVRVRDTGLGMTQEQIDSLFQPFNRLGREASEIEGTGIGLVITRSLVELMNGRIDVRSQPGRGTEFRVELPLDVGADVDADAALRFESAPAAADGSDQSPAGCVLYIDDDVVNRVLMQAFLGLRPNISLSLAEDGATGLALARARRFDLLLVDMMMPGMNGLQVVQAVRADAELRGTPCVAVSANAMPHEIAEALAAGFDGYLTKPLSAPVLLGEVDKVLSAESRKHPAALPVRAPSR